MNKKLLLVFSFITIALVSLGACSAGTTGDGEKVQKITLYSVGGADDLFEIWIPAFEEATDGKYQIEYARGNPQEVINKIKAAGDNNNIDIVSTGVDGLNLGVKEGIWEQLYPEYSEEIRYDELTDIAKTYLDENDGYGAIKNTDPGGPILVYNKDKVPNPPKTYEELKDWIKENPGKFTYADISNSGPSRGFFFGLAQSLGEDFSSGEELTKTFEYLKEIDQYIDYYPSQSSDVFDLLFDGTIDIAPHMPLWYANVKNVGEVPDNFEQIRLEDAKQVIDSQFLVIPKELPENRREAALEFIEFVMSSEINAQQYQVGRVPGNENASSDHIFDEYQDQYKGYIEHVLPDFVKDGNAYVPEGDWVLFPKNEVIVEYYEDWENIIQANK